MVCFGGRPRRFVALRSRTEEFNVQTLWVEEGVGVATFYSLLGQIGIFPSSCDSSAARRLARGVGAGKLMNIETWEQQFVCARRPAVGRLLGQSTSLR